MEIFPISTIASLFVLYLVTLAVYRLYFHPLTRFPGPVIARLTFWTEFYWDVVRSGQYLWTIEEWHEKYGPIIRISPDELHINDSTFYDTIYAGTSANRRIDKWSKNANLFGTGMSGFGTVGHELHRARRASIAPAFGRRAVVELQPLIVAKIEYMMRRVREFKGSEKPIELFAAFSALTGDIISQYSFGPEAAMDLLSEKDFAPDWHALIVDFAAMGGLGKKFRYFWTIMNSFPPAFTETMQPAMKRILALKRMVLGKVKVILESKGKESGDRQRTIFHEIVESDMPEEEKRVERLGQEADVVMAAGTVTTAEALAVICFYVLNDPKILARLREELQPLTSKGPEKLRWQDLEPLPYLSAVIKEGLRVCPGVTARLPRIQPDNIIQFNKWTIPPGTPVSMSIWTVHQDPSIFTSPKTFNPDRWFAPDSDRLERYLIPFSKGTRQCVGIELAKAEMYLALASFLGAEDMRIELFETTARDVEVVRDNFNPGFPRDSKGVRVVVT